MTTKQRPRIAPVLDRHSVKAAILEHGQNVPRKYGRFFLRPRWDSRLMILRGSDGYAIRYDAVHNSTEIYRLTTDDVDRDVYHIVKHVRAVP